MNQRQNELLIKLLAQATAPFREGQVVRVVTQALEQARVPYFMDPAGNIVVGVGSRKEYGKLLAQRGPEPVRVFIAHMDHPGFHGVRWRSSDRLKIKWHGGSPVRHLAGGRVWLAAAGATVAEGRLTGVKLTKSRCAIDCAEVRIPAGTFTSKRPAASRLYGGFLFHAPVWRRGKRLYCRAADDLVGVFAIINTAAGIFRNDDTGRPPFIGLLTRGEEVGFIGAIAHFELGWLRRAKRPIICVSLEASRTLPGASLGRGPVIRLGDRRTVFDPGGLKVLAELAKKTLRGGHQKRIMDGGACEAAVATAYGFPTIGISVPLGNYHNQGFEGGPDCAGKEGPAPEFIHLDDVDGLLKLCRALMQDGLQWGDPWYDTRARLLKNLRRYKRHLPVSAYLRLS